MDWIKKGIIYVFQDFLQDLTDFFGETLANVMGLSKSVLGLDLVQNGIGYAQKLAFTLLVLKVMNEAFQTYILYQNGDPDSDVNGLTIRTGQAVAIIAFMPDLVKYVFEFGSKILSDIATLGIGQAGVGDWTMIITSVMSTGGLSIVLTMIIFVVLLLVVAFQATIRGAELALISVIGPIMALNITSNNRSMWSSWFRQLVIICTAQALQMFMIKGAMALVTTELISGGGVLLILGWLWVAIKTPKYLQQFTYSTGFTSTSGGAIKQAGSMRMMRRMMAAK